MDARSPADWVDRAAERDADAVALAFTDGVVTYGQLADQVHRRAQDLVRAFPDAAPGSVYRIPVRLDLSSIVEVLGHQRAELVPLPDAGGVERTEGRSDGAVVAVATSGTSGSRRIVPLTMRNIAASAAASRSRLGTGPDDRWLLCLPIDHIGGLSVLFRSFEAGGAVVVGAFDAALPDLIDRTRPTVASMVPTMVHRLVGTDPTAVASIGAVLVGGGRLPSTVAERAARAGVRFLATYGSTETSSQVATMVPGESLRHPGYVGAPLDGFSVAIDAADADGAGTIVVDGPAVFGGYLGEPGRTGPYRTPDIGRIGSDGSLTILGRSDDVVVTGGINVSLLAVADAISGVGGIDDVAVVGVDDDEWGTAVCALVASDLDAAAVRSRLDAELSGAIRPRRVRVTAAIPLLPNGKHDLASVRAVFAGNPRG